MFSFFKGRGKEKLIDTKEEEYPAQLENDKSDQEISELVNIDKQIKQISLVEIIPRDTQQTLRGTKKRFSENINYNLLLLSERLPTPNLVIEKFTVGSIAQRKVVMAYLKNRANPRIIAEIRKRIKKNKAETILESSYIERNIENSNSTPFPQVEITTKPDVAESALLQGRIAVITDASCHLLLAPTTFFDLLDTPDDAYTRWFFAASFFRIVRYIMFILAASLPGFYIALTSYNPELIPTQLLFLILAGQEDTPFPVYFEAFMMMGVVEAIRLMMKRMPTQLGVSLALFGGIALIIAGLETDIVSGPVTIIVTLTILSSFAIPNYDLRSSVRIIQFFTMVMSSFLGLFGFAAAFFYIAIHLATLKSFGVPYMAPLAPLEASGWGHTILRDNTVSMAKDETYEPVINNINLDKGDPHE